MNAMFRSPLLCAASFALCFAATPALADGPGSGEGQGPRIGVGLGVVSEGSPYRGVGTETKVLPLLMFENRHVRVLGPNLDLKLPPAGPVSFALSAKYSDNGYKASDAGALQGMAERKDGFWLGAKATWDTPWVNLSAGILGDAPNHSGGQQLKLEASRGYTLGPRMRLEPRLGLTWLDKAYVDHFYGVDAGEGTAARAGYKAPATVNTELRS